MIVDVALGARTYPIHIEAGLLARAGALLAPLVAAKPGGKRLAVVTDRAVAGLHLPALEASLAAEGIAVDAIVLEPGEGAKNWAGLERVCEGLLALGVERRDVVVALGGGVVGDLTGFAASILRRGCGFVQIPTTLLAQVDSSVGGKTAINAAAGKNLIGAFHQPAMVLIDPQVLATLPPRELRAGYAEVVKYGLLGDAGFFDWCEANAAAVLAGDAAAQAEAIAVSCRAKARIVAADERETEDVRALLNLGHTFGHAFEAEAGFSDRLLHGEGVALGMALAFAFSARLGLCPAADAARAQAHLAAHGFTLSPAALGLAAPPARLIAHMMQDKKVSAGRLPFILVRGIGQAFVARDVALAEVEAFLAEVVG
ncbi:3-dehydroquinate synthase [Polymorphobacter multimanifer]|uniref:3-dehydroquinate synthase n=1 Tax=Polymorphobacter multimanifer TaxID=1070431 RepID=A0A841LEC4_9SPHN|nr:3-dehydroquinate synthase [Polymorphobacter multimanifer]MBB6228165.1 3-dehydroquinate synthase [Polymorphobacter multimanifer]GGI80947.1 3-dehydroquinate synthase [Polymorphobacter multimanifer]